MPMETGIFASRGRPANPGVTATSAAPIVGAGLLRQGFGFKSSASVDVNSQGANVATSFGISGLMAFAMVLGGLWAAERYLPD